MCGRPDHAELPTISLFDTKHEVFLFKDTFVTLGDETCGGGGGGQVHMFLPHVNFVGCALDENENVIPVCVSVLTDKAVVLVRQ